MTLLVDPPADPAASPVDPAASPADPAASPADPAASPADPAASPADPAASPVEYQLTMPEGVELAQADADALLAVAKDAKLKPETVQAIADIAAQREQARAVEFQAQVKAWADAVKADKELGAPEALASAIKVVDTFGTPELKTLLAESGLGNHPELVRFVQKVAKAMSEDTIHGGSVPAGGARNAASVLYGTTA